VQALIDTQSSGKESKSFSSISSYTETLLSFHVRGAFTAPLSRDTHCTTWLLHKNNQVAFQTMQGVGLADVLDLAEWFSEDGGDLW
jgi:hypothetical protein